MAVMRQAPVRRHRPESEPADTEVPAPAADGAEDLIDGIDDLLDEIDSILEAQSVLTAYRQRSGQ